MRLAVLAPVEVKSSYEFTMTVAATPSCTKAVGPVKLVSTHFVDREPSIRESTVSVGVANVPPGLEANHAGITAPSEAYK